jgi:hypothetical protein
LQSLADELRVQATRVRDLIGSKHWYSDGHHKEYLLIELLRRHLPHGVIASRGFVLSPTDPNTVSREQDILVVDCLQEAPLFAQGGVVFVGPKSVKAAISVKTTMSSETIADSVAGLNTVRDVAVTFPHIDQRSLWTAAYYFEVDSRLEANPTLIYDGVARAMQKHPVKPELLSNHHPCPSGPDMHCSAKQFAIKLEHAYRQDHESVTRPRLLGYTSPDLATAIFLGALLDHVASIRGASISDFNWFADNGAAEPLKDPERRL